jgi:hypothetical protein
MISPHKPRWTASGLRMMSVRSMKISPLVRLIGLYAKEIEPPRVCQERQEKIGILHFWAFLEL